MIPTCPAGETRQLTPITGTEISHTTSHPQQTEQAENCKPRIGRTGNTTIQKRKTYCIKIKVIALITNERTIMAI